MALFDLVGKALGVGAATLLGGRRRAGKIPLKFSIGAFEPARAAQVATAAMQLGLRAVKVKVGLHVESDLKRVEAVRSAVGMGFPLAVDGNGGWTVAETMKALPALEKCDVTALEQPLRRGDFRGCALIRQRTSIPIMLDESIFTIQDALEAIRQEACDLISIYPGKNGGLLRSMAIAELAASARHGMRHRQQSGNGHRYCRYVDACNRPPHSRNRYSTTLSARCITKRQ